MGRVLRDKEMRSFKLMRATRFHYTCRITPSQILFTQGRQNPIARLADPNLQFPGSLLKELERNIACQFEFIVSSLAGISGHLLKAAG